MLPPGIPANEQERMTVLREYEVLDTSEEVAFDALTRLAAHILDVPIALVSIVGQDRQWFKSRFGLDALETPRDVSFCAHVVASGEALLVADARSDLRFFDSPLVEGSPGIVFYLGVPLESPEGFTLGALCVIDHVPRTLSDEKRSMLELLARQTMSLLELRRKSRTMARQQAELETYRRFFQISGDLLCTIDADLFFRDLNPAWEPLLGWTHEELRSRSAMDFIHREDDASTREVARRLLAENGSIVGFEHRFLHKEGHWVNLSWATSASNGMFYGTARDVTEYKRALAAVVWGERRLRSIIDTAGDAIITVSSDGLIEHANDATRAVFGYAPGELIGQHVGILASPQDRERQRTQVTAWLAQEPKARTTPREPVGSGWELIAGRKDGSSFPAELSVGEYYIDRARYYTIIIRDVSARRRAAADLLQFRTTLNHTLDAIFIVVPTTLQIVYVNQGAQMQTGQSEGALLAMTLADLEPALGQAGYLARLRPLLLGDRQMLTFEANHRGADGCDVPVEVVVQLVAPTGEPSRLVVIARDVRERARNDRLKREFLSTVSHELRTPLTAIRGALGLVAGGVTGPLPALAQEYVDIALSSSERLVRLVNDMLDLDRMAEGHLTLRLEEVDVALLCRQAVAASEPHAASLGVHLSLRCADPGLLAYAQADRVTQVLNNLLSNAVKFSPKGEGVEVSVVAVRRGVRVEVRDHGPGIPEAFRARIFQRFAQASGGDDRMAGGSGLGLAISKALVEKMGGEIGYANERGGGARFWFELPTMAAARAGTAPPTAAVVRVLACGASDSSYDLLQQLLTGVSHEVFRVPVGGRADGAWRDGPWDLIVLSRRTGCGETVPFLRRFCAEEAVAPPPIIVLPEDSEPGSTSLGAAIELLDIVVNALDAAQIRRAPRWALRRGARLGRRVLHVDDDAALRRVVAGLAPADWELFGVGTLSAGRDALATRRFDLIVLDLELPDGWGGDLLDAADGVPVVVFSGGGGQGADP